MNTTTYEFDGQTLRVIVKANGKKSMVNDRGCVFWGKRWQPLIDRVIAEGVKK